MSCLCIAGSSFFTPRASSPPPRPSAPAVRSPASGPAGGRSRSVARAQRQGHRPPVKSRRGRAAARAAEPRRFRVARAERRRHRRPEPSERNGSVAPLPLALRPLDCAMGWAGGPCWPDGQQRGRSLLHSSSRRPGLPVALCFARTSDPRYAAAGDRSPRCGARRRGSSPYRWLRL